MDPWRLEDIRRRLIETACRSDVITYSDLWPRAPRGPRTYLYEIGRQEKAARRPPLTALAVRKDKKHRPAKGWDSVGKEAGYGPPRETWEDGWQRARRDVYAYWQAQPECKDRG